MKPNNKLNTTKPNYNLSYNDYFPYGMLVLTRNYSNPVYRYGFQGQEKDDEIKGIGNSINYKFRMHSLSRKIFFILLQGLRSKRIEKYVFGNPRIGRFFAVDPLAWKYPWNSPYAFSENRVIDGVELEGLEGVDFRFSLMMRAKGGIQKEAEEYVVNQFKRVGAETINYSVSDSKPSWLDKFNHFIENEGGGYSFSDGDNRYEGIGGKLRKGKSFGNVDFDGFLSAMTTILGASKTKKIPTNIDAVRNLVNTTSKITKIYKNKKESELNLVSKESISDSIYLIHVYFSKAVIVDSSGLMTGNSNDKIGDTLYGNLMSVYITNSRKKADSILENATPTHMNLTPFTKHIIDSTEIYSYKKEKN